MSATVENKTEIKHYYKLVSSPHLRSGITTEKAMWIVVLSLLPCAISGIIFFGFNQLPLLLTTSLTAIISEYLIQFLRKKEITIKDGSAFLTGLLLGLILPPNFPLVYAALGSVAAIGIGKQVFGGLGFNIFNPALVGRAFLQAAFPVAITTWTKPNYAVDANTGATVLSAFKFDKIIEKNPELYHSLIKPLFLGNVGGSLGETSALAILIGGLILLIFGIANWRIPLSMILGLLTFAGIFWLIDPSHYASPLHHLLSGGFLFGAFFMATDWVTSPLTSVGMWIYGIGIALLVVLIRIFGGLPEGVMYAILIMNAFTPLINRYTIPKIFGATK
jgi:electron transport complex protein RnfD